MDRELKYLKVPFNLEETKNEGGFFYFRGYASTKDLDSYDDIVEPTAFNKSIARKKPIMLYQHQYDMPIGVFDELSPDEQGLFVRGRMPVEDDFVRGRIIPQLKIGSITAMSIGYRVKQAELTKEGYRLIKEADLPEISLVSFPANESAVITDLKSMKLRGRSERFDISKLTHGLYRDEKGEHFMIADDEAIVPRAVISARVKLAHKSERIDESVADSLNALYERMEMSIPFVAGKSQPFTKIEIENMLPADLVTALRYGQLTKGAAEYVASLIPGGQEKDSEAGSDVSVLESLRQIKDQLKGASYGS